MWYYKIVLILRFCSTVLWSRCSAKERFWSAVLSVVWFHQQSVFEQLQLNTSPSSSCYCCWQVALNAPACLWCSGNTWLLMDCWWLINSADAGRELLIIHQLVLYVVLEFVGFPRQPSRAFECVVRGLLWSFIPSCQLCSNETILSVVCRLLVSCSAMDLGFAWLPVNQLQLRIAECQPPMQATSSGWCTM